MALLSCCAIPLQAQLLVQRLHEDNALYPCAILYFHLGSRPLGAGEIVSLSQYRAHSSYGLEFLEQVCLQCERRHD